MSDAPWTPESPLLSEPEMQSPYDTGALAQAHFAELYGKEQAGSDRERHQAEGEQ